MTDLIRNTLHTVFPEAERLEIVDAYGGTKGHGAMLSGLEEVRAKRAKGGLRRPVVIYGFDSEERIRQHECGSILDAPGVFYLRLPALLINIESVFRKAVNTHLPPNNAIDEKSFRDYAIREIRAFKHRCDNLWTSMEMNANRARMALDNSPGTMPSALLEFRTSKVEKLADEYTELVPRAKRLGVTGAEKVKGMMYEVIGKIGLIQEKAISPNEAVDLAFDCSEKIKAISDVFAQSTEIYGRKNRTEVHG